MKNIIFLVIDAFCYNNLNRKIGDEYTTPFLKKLIRENIFNSNMFAQAPYTEASYIALLSGENTMDSGGYLFGNNTTQTTNFNKYKKLGYTTISQYAPYVYSKGYLRDVDLYYYTRLISVKILFDYRLYYYKDKYLNGKISKIEKETCINLLDEEFEAWITQAKKLISEDKTCVLIQDWVNKDNIVDVLEKLEKEYKSFTLDSTNYLMGIFDNYANHTLLKLDNQYNIRKHLKNCDLLREKYNLEFWNAQKKYNKIIRKQFPDINYLLNTLFGYKDGFKKFKGLVHNYMRYYGNSFLKDYLTITNENTKDEVCMKKQFDYVLNLVDEINNLGNLAYVYLNVQDFHLPSVVHSIDLGDYEYQCTEIEEALKFFKQIDKNYKGNILADLSARFCDNKVQELYNKLVEKYGDNFTLVVTADHGFPSYFTPPRSVIYNQTFSEAFHVPFIITSSNHKIISEFSSTMDFYELVTTQNLTNKRNYILSEYGGPGCPSIVDKDIWYTYIDSKYRLSVEVMIDERVSYKHITGIFDRVNDVDEKKNLVKKMKGNPEIDRIITIIDERNAELRKKYGNTKFLKHMNKFHIKDEKGEILCKQ